MAKSLEVWVGNVPHRLTYLNTWSPASIVVWGLGWLGGLAWQEEGASLEVGVRVSKLTLLPVHSLCVRCDFSAPRPFPMPGTCWHASRCDGPASLWTVRRTNFFIA